MVFSHATGTVSLAYMMVDVWDCFLYWWVFALCSCLPATIGKTFGIFFSILKGKFNKCIF
jgi:hypothetical protein